MSVPQSNSTKMRERPTSVVDWMRVTPWMPLTARSSGMVTWFSTSSGAFPGASVMMVTRGLVRSGRTSTGSWVSWKAPHAMTASAMVSTSRRLWRDFLMKKSSIGL